MSDPITNPSHYQGSIECIDAIHSALGTDGFVYYCRGNAMKYIFRAGKKGDVLEDLHKASTYLVFAANATTGTPLKEGITLVNKPETFSIFPCTPIMVNPSDFTDKKRCSTQP